MIPKIIRVRKGWAAGTKENGYDLCDTFWIALRYWLWHCGVSPKIAFWKYNKRLGTK